MRIRNLTQKRLRQGMVVAGAAWCGVSVWAQSAEALTERDFLEAVPIVLSVSRLPQRIDETPGAVTVLDREMIRQTGVRDVADLMRFVPGFRVSDSFESNSPQASYHVNLGDYSNRVQVMVDGRSVYSPFLLGSTGPGLQAVALDDIERIEVIRGSNSAAYGARAFLGMINIVTRDPLQTLGASVHLGMGSNRVRDALFRFGATHEGLTMRVVADRRGDDGLHGEGGADHVVRVNARVDAQLGADDRLEFRLGRSEIVSGVGIAGDPDIGLRNRVIATSFAQFDWRRVLDADEDLAFQYAHMQESVRDQVPNLTYAGVLMNLGGRADSDALMAQHSVRLNSALRWVWGGELRTERVMSRAQYDTDADFVTDFTRIFANAEWRMAPRWVLNTGGMLEHNSVAGTTFSPRAMVHWHFAPGQTLRYGVSGAHRPPSTFENFSNQVYRAPSLAEFEGGVFVNYRSRPGLKPETIEAQEIGYLGRFERWRMELDVRMFDERVTDVIKERKESNGYTKYYVNTVGVGHDVHGSPLVLQGVEYQLTWQPWDGGQLVFGQWVIDNGQLLPRQKYRSSSLMATQKLPQGWSLSLMHSENDPIPELPGEGVPAPAVQRTDLRLARAMRWAGHRAELALVVQNLGADYMDFVTRATFQRQAYVQFRLEH